MRVNLNNFILNADLISNLNFVPDMLPTLVEVKNGAVTELVMISSLTASTELICGQVGTTQWCSSYIGLN